MAGRHSAKPEKKSKVPLIIIIAVAVAVIAGVIVLIIFLNGNSQIICQEPNFLLQFGFSVFIIISQ